MQETLDWQTSHLAAIAAHQTDLVILPENSNVTGYSSLDEMIHVIHNQGAEYVKTLQKEADRIGAVIMAGLMTQDEKGVLRNQLAVFQPGKPSITPYTKTHLVVPELKKGIKPGDEANLFEINGVKYGCAICYDFYFPELFCHYAKLRADVVVIVSHQRQEPSENLFFLRGPAPSTQVARSSVPLPRWTIPPSAAVPSPSPQTATSSPTRAAFQASSALNSTRMRGSSAPPPTASRTASSTTANRFSRPAARNCISKREGRAPARPLKILYNHKKILRTVMARRIHFFSANLLEISV